MSKGLRNFLIVCGGIVGVGVVMCIAGLVFGARFSDATGNGSGFGNVVSREYKATSFTSIEVDNNLNDIQLVEGDSYKVELVYNEKYTKPTAEVNNGKLTVKDHKKNIRFFNFDLFGLLDEKDTCITIYYPSTAKFDDVKLNSDMGDIDIDNLNAKMLQIDSSAGDVTMENVTAGTLKTQSDLGSVEATNIKAGGADLRLSAGDLDLMGTFKGSMKVSSDMGDCAIASDLPMNQYDIKVKVDLGDCTVAGEDKGTQFEKDSGKPNSIEVNTSAGDVDLNFF